MPLLGNIADLQSDRTLSVDGIPIDLGAGRRVWVKRAGGHNREWSLGLAEVAEAIPGLDDLDPAERTFRLNSQVAAERLNSKWEGFEDPAGNPVDYSVEAGLELLSEAPDILDEILATAMNRAAYALEADAGKSES